MWRLGKVGFQVHPQMMINQILSGQKQNWEKTGSCHGFVKVETGWLEDDELICRNLVVLLFCCPSLLHFVSRSLQPCLTWFRLRENLVLLS